jgi:hypothetical protein
MTARIKYSFIAPIWQYKGKGAWFFVSLPLKLSQEIRNEMKSYEEGWGRLKTEVQIGNSKWKTTLWYDSKANTYLIAIKAEIRTKEKINTGSTLTVHFWL